MPKCSSKLFCNILNIKNDIFSFCGKLALYGSGSTVSNNVNFVTYHLNVTNMFFSLIASNQCWKGSEVKAL